MKIEEGSKFKIYLNNWNKTKNKKKEFKIEDESRIMR